MRQECFSKRVKNYIISVAGLTEKGVFKEVNQDSFRIGILEEKQIAYIIVADGLGSCKYSDQGANKIADIVESWIITKLPEYECLSNQVADVLSKRMFNKWNSSFSIDEIADYDTTIHLAVFYKGNILIGGIGDGMALITVDDLISKDIVNGRTLFSNVTTSMCSLDGREFLKFEIVTLEYSISSIIVILCTDGISDDLIPEKKLTLSGYFQKVLKKDGNDALQIELIDWILNWQTENHCDDKTLCYLAINREII